MRLILLTVGTGRQRKQLELSTSSPRVIDAAERIARATTGVIVELEWSKVVSDLAGGGSTSADARILYETFISNVVAEALT